VSSAPSSQRGSAAAEVASPGVHACAKAKRRPHVRQWK
jgi:hypothetical protein